MCTYVQTIYIVYVFIYASIHIDCLYVYKNERIHMSMYKKSQDTYMCVCVFVYLYVYCHIRVFVCMCTYIHTYRHILIDG